MKWTWICLSCMMGAIICLVIAALTYSFVVLVCVVPLMIAALVAAIISASKGDPWM